MRKIQRGLAFAMAALFVISSSIVATATKNDIDDSKSQIVNADNMKKGFDKKGNKEKQVQDKAKKDEAKELNKSQKKQYEAEKEVLEDQKDQLEAQKADLEKQLEAAETSGDTELVNKLKAQIQQIKTDMDAIKKQMKDKRVQIKAEIKSTYTTEELANIDSVSKEIKKKHKGVDVLPVENLMVKGKHVKFDTPPVIKDGRTLIPVKALSEAFGAEVKWVSVERTVIITKGAIEIVVKLDSNKILVNGVEKTIDVPACSINARTVVPMRFIVEQLGLKVNWNGDTKDIEIEDPADTGTTPPVTTGSAITVTEPTTTETAPAETTSSSGNK